MENKKPMLISIDPARGEDNSVITLIDDKGVVLQIDAKKLSTKEIQSLIDKVFNDYQEPQWLARLKRLMGCKK